MNPILRFIRTTITGGILFMLPFVVLFLVFEKAFSIVHRISEPVSSRVTESVLGFDGSRLITLILLFVICFAAGLMFRSEKVKKSLDKLEDQVLIFIPGYSLLKSVAADTLGEETAHKLIPVRVEDGEGWLLGFLVEEGKGFSTVFLPDAPRHDAGEIRMLPSSMVVKLEINSQKFTKMIKSYGVGALSCMDQE